MGVGMGQLVTYLPDALYRQLLDVGAEVSVVRHDDGRWQARIRPGQYASAASLIGIDRWAREQLVTPHGWINYRFQSADFDLDAVVRDARDMRRISTVSTALAQELTLKALSFMPATGVSFHEAAILLGISPQRVAQLSQRHTPAHTPPRTR